VHKAHAAGDQNSRVTEQPVARSGPVTRVVISFDVPTPAALAPQPAWLATIRGRSGKIGDFQ
jgi:hypothetical protein